MARQRRGGGFRPPELRGTLGTLLRTTLAQAGTLRDALERGAREGRSRLDSALSTRRRTDALAELGELVLDLIRRGEIDLDELPEARDLVAHLDDIDAGHAGEDDEAPALATARNRFDARRREDDGTVSSQTWSRAGAAKPPAKPRVWRPPVDDAAEAEIAGPDEVAEREQAASSRRPAAATVPQRPAPARKAAAGAEDKPAAPGRSTKSKDPGRKGGIHFDDDEDSAEYMHPDDVPPKGTPDGDA